ncbi:MAG: 4Fe-4S dicluster domain-containing protein, partial [Dehalococcoidales bacterium]|nr:4Fe-4S dicluster domain-containing protein [Dehalococcoidales bacterium]
EIVQLLGKSWKLTRAEKAEMKRLKDELGTRFCRRCDYCQPCTAGIPISTVMVGSSFAKRMPPERLFGPGMLADAMSKAGACTDCGECETRCPYNLPIREIIRERIQWYQAAKEEYLKKNAPE